MSVLFRFLGPYCGTKRSAGRAGDAVRPQAEPGNEGVIGRRRRSHQAFLGPFPADALQLAFDGSGDTAQLLGDLAVGLAFQLHKGNLTEGVVPQGVEQFAGVLDHHVGQLGRGFAPQDLPDPGIRNSSSLGP